jgi:hypothetical protein
VWVLNISPNQANGDQNEWWGFSMKDYNSVERRRGHSRGEVKQLKDKLVATPTCL